MPLAENIFESTLKRSFNNFFRYLANTRVSIGFLNENVQEANICFTITCKYGSDYCNIAKLFHFSALSDDISNVSVESVQKGF